MLGNDLKESLEQNGSIKFHSTSTTSSNSGQEDLPLEISCLPPLKKATS